jgi:SsrA-binding protein
MLAKNKKAYFDYEILDTFEAGIVLEGWEVKSIRNKRANLKGSYVSFRGDEAWIEKMHISAYQAANHPDGNTEDSASRRRKLLLNRREIDKLQNQSNTAGIAIIPLKLFLKNNRVKVAIGVGRGKKRHDKRESIKRRDTDRDLRRQLKRHH